MDLATHRTGRPVSRKTKEDKSDIAPNLSLGMIRVKHIVVALLLSVFFFFVFCFIALHGYIAWVLSNPTVAPPVLQPFTGQGAGL